MGSEFGEAAEVGPAGKVDQVLRAAGRVVGIDDQVLARARGEPEDVASGTGAVRLRASEQAVSSAPISLPEVNGSPKSASAESPPTKTLSLPE
jgi:hypothetical protein